MSDDSLLRDLRQQMDEINRRLVALLHDRAQLARRIGTYKREHGIAAVDAVREQQMLAALLAEVPNDGFSTAATERILAEVFEQSKLLVQAACE